MAAREVNSLDVKRLHNVRAYMFARGERLWFSAWWLAVIGLAAGLGLAVVQDSRASIGLGLCAALSPVAITWLRELSNQVRAKGDLCRRLVLYSDGLGRPLPPAEVALVESSVLGRSIPDATYVEPYYASTADPGPRRLAENTAESAYFTSALATIMARRFLIGAVAAGAVVIACLAILLQADANKTALKVAGQWIGPAIAFIISGDVLVVWWQYHCLALSAQQVFRSAGEAAAQNAELPEIFAIVEEYHLVLAQSPPLTKGLHTKYHGALNVSYRAAMASIRSGSSSASSS